MAVKKLVLTPTYESYGDVELLANFLVSTASVYNVYKEGRNIVVELSDDANPAEVVRAVLDLGHEIVLPHFSFSTRQGLDDREVVKRLMAHPLIVAAEYYPRSGRGVVVAVPGTAEEEVVVALRRVLGVVTIDRHYVEPVRLSFG